VARSSTDPVGAHSAGGVVGHVVPEAKVSIKVGFLNKDEILINYVFQKGGMKEWKR